MYLAQMPLCNITSTWGVWIGMISCTNTMEFTWNHGKATNIYFEFILDVAITNAFILLSNYLPIAAKLRSWKEFRAELAMSLIGEYNSRKVPGRQPSLPSLRPTTLMKMEKRSRCSYCNANKIAKYTYWKCNDGNKYISAILVICSQTAFSNILNQLCNLMYLYLVTRVPELSVFILLYFMLFAVFPQQTM